MHGRGQQKKMISRKLLLLYAGISISVIALMFNSASFAASISSAKLQKKAREKAEAFLFRISKKPLQKIGSVTLVYEVHMDCSLNVKIRLNATVKMEKQGDRYASTFTLTAPKGKGVWSWLLLNFVGKYTKEYKELVKSIETKWIERFHVRDGRFRTNDLEEFLLADRYYANQTAIKVNFNYDEGLVKFWEDKNKKIFSRSMPYTDQVGPVTGFFNYIFYDQPSSRMIVINVLRQVEDEIVSDDPASQNNFGKKKVHYFFNSEVAFFGINTTGKHVEHPMRVYLEKSNFLDLIYGENIYYKFVRDSASNIKVPCAARIEGIISKTKKRNKLKALREENPGREITEKELFAEVGDILAAWNVKAYLRDFDFAVIP